MIKNSIEINCIKCLLMLSLVISSIFCSGQKNIDYQTIDNYSDSIALSYLMQFYPTDSLAKKEILIDGAVQKVKRYYSYLSFNLPFKYRIKVISFGALIEHTPSFMLVIRKLDNNAEEHFVLGRTSLEEDLMRIHQLFSSLPSQVSDKYKLEILEIFLQCKRGITQTARYIH